jgi:hypothetical protein
VIDEEKLRLGEEAFQDPMPTWSYLPTVILWSHAASKSTLREGNLVPWPILPSSDVSIWEVLWIPEIIGT